MSGYKANILVVDDEPDIRQLVQEILQDEGYVVYKAGDAAEARQMQQRHQPDLILLDIWMPDTDGITLLKEWGDEEGFVAPVIMMSGHGTIETAVEATKLGAYEFLEKPLSLARLLLVVERAVDAHMLQRENVGLKQQLSIVHEPVGRSAFAERIKEQLKRLAQHETKVMFVGESGSGKELYARFLHEHSGRKNGPFIDVAVGSIASENAEVEFFGKEQGGGVFPGLMERAHGGVLFLAEIAGMDAQTQLKFVSALESSSFLRVGGTEQVHVDVRVIVTTRVVLEREVKEGRFRQDLYYLLNEVAMEVLPLREHSEDIPALLQFYIDFFVQHEKLAFRKFTMPALNFLRNYIWPGNVRELKNLVQRLMILGAGDDIELAEVKAALGAVLGNAEMEQPETVPVFFKLSLKDAREQFEKAYLEYHFEKNQGNVAKLATAVGVERTHLYRKLHALNIKE
ncbi:MAG: sigma-54-dependent Fis family transcriptional regulator [Gammaproteobacteria bacterium]|jgi:two-component system, NtrC family, nitrogen regulation response regulator NtrX|nr:sigma-54-dependent Fis family transcriptional regulator [Gammaproteobacteria bacterium]MBT4147396.1 sigma-54-dependent Fis family transcriptional regulator [Gammaproteobacteria bacterium]MBT5222228.1 sigma-54-dependent Fis family transcriptional regulator [Gammaproteobacteria bacterium]MBT6420070.1 sigma-54-dependent Fis family transcriptional regulator [Gammaproteobacteria bacterium]MBT6577139.1 sigma-54-dependent Fis family transcriptional regulator [Gammaproteobacteria bacterium]